MPDLPPGDPRHGTNGYTNLGCRCPKCKAANATWQWNARERRRLNLANLPDSAHGDPSTYTNHMCRCQRCKTAHAKLRKAQNERAAQRLQEESENAS